MHAQSRPVNFNGPSDEEIIQVGLNVQVQKRLLLVWLHGVNRSAIMHWKMMKCDFIQLGSIIEVAVRPIELKEETLWVPYEVTRVLKVLETVKNEVMIRELTCFAMYEVDFADLDPMFMEYSAITGNYVLKSEVGNVLLEKQTKNEDGCAISAKKVVEYHDGISVPSKIVAWFKYARCLVPAAMIQRGCDVHEEVYSYAWRMEQVVGTMADYKAKQAAIQRESIPAEELPRLEREDDMARQKRQARLEFEANQQAPAPVNNLPPAAPIQPGFDVYGTARPSTEGMFFRARQHSEQQALQAQQAAREAEQQAQLRAQQAAREAEQQAQLRAQQAAREAEQQAQLRAQQAAREAQKQAAYCNQSTFSGYGGAGPVGSEQYGLPAAPSHGATPYAPSVASSRGTDQYGSSAGSHQGSSQYGPSGAPPAPQSYSGVHGNGYAGEPAPSHMPPRGQITIEELAKKLDDLTAYVYRQDSEKEALRLKNAHLRNDLAKIIFHTESFIDIPKVKAQMKIQDIETFNALEDAIAQVKATASDAEQSSRPRGY